MLRRGRAFFRTCLARLLGFLWLDRFGRRLSFRCLFCLSFRCLFCLSLCCLFSLGRLGRCLRLGFLLLCLGLIGLMLSVCLLRLLVMRLLVAPLCVLL